MTSRMLGDMQRLQRALQPSACLSCVEIPMQVSLSDMQCYVSSRFEGLPVGSGHRPLHGCLSGEPAGANPYLPWRHSEVEYGKWVDMGVEEY